VTWICCSAKTKAATHSILFYFLFLFFFIDFFIDFFNAFFRRFVTTGVQKRDKKNRAKIPLAPKKTVTHLRQKQNSAAPLDPLDHLQLVLGPPWTQEANGGLPYFGSVAWLISWVLACEHAQGAPKKKKSDVPTTYLF
jgi:hypothetical protein